MPRPRAAAALCLSILAGVAHAQFNPQNNQWGKDDPTDIRVMTFNVRDHLCSSNTKTNIFGSWNAMVRVIAAMEPDVILIQEAGDNSGNGTGSGVDSVATLADVSRLLFIGGNDPYRGNTPITSYVQLFRPGYDLPHVFVSSETDGFNRNVILSRFPFVDLDGDNLATRSDIVQVDPDQWAPGGDGGIRGIMTAEIDLPDALYAGDLVVANAHLKSGGNSSDLQQRLVASQNASYYFYYQYFGAGGGTPDPNNKIRRGGGTMVLGPDTPIIVGGDFNEDEDSNGRRGPADYFANGGTPGGTNGTDADQTDGVIANAREPFTNSDNTLGNSRLDYQVVSDSRATIRHAFIFDSFDAVNGGSTPPELANFPRGASTVSGMASDHLPVIVDYILAPATASPEPFDLIAPANLALTVSPLATFEWEASTNADEYQLIVATDGLLINRAIDESGLTSTDFSPAAPLSACTQYFWTVVASGPGGSIEANASPGIFLTTSIADLSSAANPGQPDGALTGADFFEFLARFSAGDLSVDFSSAGATGVPDGALTGADFFFFLNAFSQGCN